MAAVAVGLRERTTDELDDDVCAGVAEAAAAAATVADAADLASGGFSLGCLRNRCSRLLQLSDNNWVTLVVEERA